MDVPTSAIEAATRKLFDIHRDRPIPGLREDARAAIHAAMPAIREAIAQELMANADTRKNEWEAIAVRSAARVVVRGGTP